MSRESGYGVLYLVSTPIGNMEDMTLRAIRVLREADLIAAEDTRHSGKLLKHYEIDSRMVSYHDHNKKRTMPRLMERLCDGQSVALISDAGTPGISDPAFYLVREAVKQNIPVFSIPGPTAAVSALIVSGLPTDRFVFEGFLPVKKGRKTRMRLLAEEKRTLILYESPHRLLKTLTELTDHFGDRRVAVCREITKKFEETVRGTLPEAVAYFSERKILGEFVIILQGADKK